jgi:diguanylate cyclase (GGDEF)-like protein/PAS domain S-box-containing protein
MRYSRYLTDVELGARQVGASTITLPVTVIAHGICALAFCLYFVPELSPSAALISGGTAAASGMFSLLCWWMIRHSRSGSLSANRRNNRLLAAQAVVMGGWWAVVAMLVYPAVGSDARIFLGALVWAMLARGAYSLAPTALASTLYVATVATGAAVALALSGLAMSWPIALPQALFMGFVLSGVIETNRDFERRIAFEAESKARAETATLLLQDFQQQSHDILWELDADGVVSGGCKRVAELLGVSERHLTSQPVTAVLARLEATAPAAVPETEQAAPRVAAVIARRQPFRALKVGFVRNGSGCWWSLSGKPNVDSEGRCTGWRGVARDITEAQVAQEEVQWRAQHDPLTRLVNRDHFLHRLRQSLTQGAGGDQVLAVLLVDLDNFKHVNDSLGHEAGDRMLIAVGEHLRQGTRRGDIVARLGGDEFAVLMTDLATAADAEASARRVMAALGAPIEIGGARLRASASMGLALSSDHVLTASQLLRRADLALFAAKNAGRGGLEVFHEDLASRADRRRTLRQDLPDAISRQELSMHFQPVVTADRLDIFGFEALMRWTSPAHGFVPPDEFIPAAEESGLIVELGHWALNEALAAAARFDAPWRVSVNVSAAQWLDESFVSRLQAVLLRHQVAPDRLVLEITESVFLGHAEAALATMRQVRALGARMAIDDFGTGFSSLSYLSRFEVDVLKIDRCFITDIVTRTESRAIVAGFQSLGRSLGMQCVAEGVETPRQLQMLRRQGIERLQGFLIARPMPFDALAGFLAEWPGRRMQLLALPQDADAAAEGS